MTPANRFNSLLHLSTLLGVLAFTAADDVPLLALLGIIAISTSWFLTRGTRAVRPPALPRLGINLLVLAAIANAAMNAPGRPGDEIVSILGRFLVFVILIKLFDRRAIRDDAQLITLSVFIAIASILTGTQFLVGIILIAYVPVTVAAAMYWQIHAGYVLITASARDNAPPGVAPELLTIPRIPSGANPRRGFVALCLAAVLSAVAMATAIFVLVPRGIGSDFLGRFGMIRQPQIGFRESVSLGTGGLLSDNPTPVLDMSVTTPTGGNLGAVGVVWYLRGGVANFYDSHAMRWRDRGRESDDGTARTDLVDGVQWIPDWSGVISDGSAPSTTSGSLTRRIQKITMRADTLGRNLFFLWRPVGITPDRNVGIEYSKRNAAVRFSNPPPPRFSYTVESSVLDDISKPPAPPRGFQAGRIRDLANQVVADTKIAPNPTQDPSKQVALALRDHLRTNYTYTTQIVAPPEGLDAIEFFLFDHKQGHCEYFASAMAAMCQSQGIPARVATGYLVTDYNTLTGQYLVRESDAHAWVEAFIVTSPETGRGRWETFDASPPADIERLHRPPGGILAILRSWYDALEFGWTSSVISFDNTEKERPLTLDASSTTRVGMWFMRLSDRLVTSLKTIRQDPREIPRYIWWSPLALAIITTFIIAIRRLTGRYTLAHSSRTRRIALGLTPRKLPAFYANALRTLARAGFPKPDSVPPARFADTLAPRAPVAAQALRTLATLHYQSAFGNRPLAPPDLATAQAALRDLRLALQDKAARRGSQSLT